MEDDSCFQYFNPTNKEEYSWYISNWSSAIDDMLNAVLDKEGQVDTKSSSFYQSRS